MTPSIRRLLVLVAVMTFALLSLLVTGARNSNLADDPDMAPYELTNGELSKEEYMTRRAEAIAQRRGISKDAPFDRQARPAAVREMEAPGRARGENATILPERLVAGGLDSTRTGADSQRANSSVTTPVSGRTISIAVHPTNPNIVYVGAAQGGLYRSTDGGTNWTALMDNELSLAIGAIAIAPSQPDTIYVGTGETGFCGDCFFGVGVYRIDNASTATPVISGPFNDDPTNVDIFTGRGIGAIVVHPTLPGTNFCRLRVPVSAAAAVLRTTYCPTAVSIVQPTRLRLIRPLPKW